MVQDAFKIRFEVTLILAAVLLFTAQATKAEPVLLDDNLMDRVTAGTTDTGNGIVVGHGSDANIGDSNKLQLSHQAQAATRAINLTNSIESAVSNVVNIWEGNGVASPGNGNHADSEVSINQINNIFQEQPGSASLTGYLRPETEYSEITEHSGSSKYESRLIDHHDITNIFDTQTVTTTQSEGKVDTSVELSLGEKVNFSGHLGQGIAFAGDTHFKIEPGYADIGVAAENDGTGKVSAGANGSLSATGDLVFIMRVALPEITLDINGAGCAVAMGSCEADSTIVEYSSTYTDNSTLDIVENYQFGETAFSEFHHSSYRSSLQIEHAEAEYIVIDDSTLILDSEVELELTDSAQRDTRGMNIVNAIGSNVANATNLARTQSFEGSRSKLVLNQFNTVRHGH